MPPASIEQWAVVALVTASLGNYLFCSREVLPVIDIAAACGIAVCFGKFERVGNRAPIRAGLALMGMRWLDSCGWLATQAELSPHARFLTIASQACFFAAMASGVSF